MIFTFELSLKVIQDQSESNSDRGKDKKIYIYIFYHSEEAELTPLLAMTQSFEDCDWLVDQEGNKKALLRIGSIISLHFQITVIMFFLYYRTHTHTHTQNHCICILYFFVIYHTVIFNSL